MKYRVTRATTSMQTYLVEATGEQEAIANASGPGTLVGTSDLWSAVATDSEIEPPPETPSLPSGFGGYLRRISGGATEAAATAARCRQAGFAWVALMVEATDGYVVPLDATRTYAQVLAEEGFEIFVWTFPGDKRAASVFESEEAARLALTYAEATGAIGVIADIEAPYKGKAEELGALLGTISRGLAPHQSLGVASYPVPSMHPTIPWAEISAWANFGSPMFYETAQNPALVTDGLSQWGEIKSDIVPILDGWRGSGLPGATRFKSDIITVVGSPPEPKMGMVAASIWSEAQMDDAKRDVTNLMGIDYGWPRA